MSSIEIEQCLCWIRFRSKNRSLELDDGDERFLPVDFFTLPKKWKKCLYLLKIRNISISRIEKLVHLCANILARAPPLSPSSFSLSLLTISNFSGGVLFIYYLSFYTTPPISSYILNLHFQCTSGIYELLSVSAINSKNLLGLKFVWKCLDLKKKKAIHPFVLLV